jgi:hypothetical protein
MPDVYRAGGATWTTWEFTGLGADKLLRQNRLQNLELAEYQAAVGAAEAE